MLNIKTWLVDMPIEIKGACSKNEDGTYDIFINENISEEEKKKAYAHELKHIENGDFDMFDVQEIEMLAHN